MLYLSTLNFVRNLQERINAHLQTVSPNLDETKVEKGKLKVYFFTKELNLSCTANLPQRSYELLLLLKTIKKEVFLVLHVKLVS